MDRQEEFIEKHTEVLRLRKVAEDLRYQLSIVEVRLRTVERESSFLFHNLFNAKTANPSG